MNLETVVHRPIPTPCSYEWTLSCAALHILYVGKHVTEEFLLIHDYVSPDVYIKSH
jgi:hypothetical protein